MIALLRKSIVLLVLALPLAVSAQWNAYGDAVPLSCECYLLTSATNNQTSTVWNQQALDLNQPFDFTYSVFLGCNDGGADGMAWALSTNPTMQGGGAAAMGMGTISPSIGVYMDTFDNGIAQNDPPQDHITIHLNGDVNHNSPNNVVGPVPVSNIEDCQDHTLRVTWNPTLQVFTVHWDGLQMITYGIDLINNIFGGTSTVYWGFGGSTGGLNNEHRFCLAHSSDFTLLDQVVCQGIQVTGADNSNAFGDVVFQSWNWGDGTIDTTATPSHIYFTDTVTTVQYIMIDQSGCADTTDIPMTVASPTATATATDSSICAGESTQLQVVGTGGFTFDYSWSPAASLSNSGIAMPTATPADTQLYVVTISDQSLPQCAATDSIEIAVIPAPSVDLGPDSAICTGDSVVLDAGNAGSVFVWQDGSGNQTFSALATGMYAVSVTSPSLSSCTVSDSVMISVVDYPTVSLGPDTVFCDAASLLLNAGNTGYNYLWQDGATSQTYSASDSGTYYVQVSSPLNGQCAAADTIHLSVVPAPIVDLGNDTAICAGDSVQFDAANAGLDFIWSNGATTQQIHASATNTYAVTVTNTAASNCSISDSVQLAVRPYPAFALPDTQLICETDTLIIATGLAGFSHAWNTGSTQASIAVDTTGLFWVTVADTVLAACETIDSAYVSEIEFPVVDLGPDTLICLGDSLVLHAGNTGAVFEWQDGSANQTFTALTDGTYAVTVSTAALGSCSASDQISIFTVPVPMVDIGADTTICAGDSIELNAGNVNSVFTWSTGWWGRLETVSQAGVYSVTVASPILNACAATDSMELFVQALPAINLGADTTICPGDEAELDAGPDGISYLWQDGSVDQFFFAADSGLYWVTATDTLGCQQSDTIEIDVGCPFVLELPNVITPNQDGINDLFEVGGTGILSYELSVFNRWGNLVGEGSNQAPWDGRDFSGNALVSGTYFYTLIATPLDGSREHETYTGTVSVLY